GGSGVRTRNPAAGPRARSGAPRRAAGALRSGLVAESGGGRVAEGALLRRPLRRRRGAGATVAVGARGGRSPAVPRRAGATAGAAARLIGGGTARQRER